jgi:hypothetical protein
MNKEDVVFHLNNTKYEFKRNTDRNIKIGKEPFVINKHKSCEIVLYSFAFFNEAIRDADLKTFKLYNKYRLYGIHNRESGDSGESGESGESGKVPVANNKKTINSISNIEINIPPVLNVKDVKNTEVDTLIAAKEIADIKKI